MIYDSLKNAKLYGDISRLESVVDFINTHDMKSLSTGRNDIDGEDLYVNVIEYETTTDPVKFESHIEYIDVHYMVDGAEGIALDDVDNLTVSDAYDKDMEAALYVADVKDVVTLKTGMFVVLYPHEAHRGKIPCGKTAPLRKAVFKIKI